MPTAFHEHPNLLQRSGALGLKCHDHPPMIPNPDPSGSLHVGDPAPVQAHHSLDRLPLYATRPRGAYFRFVEQPTFDGIVSIGLGPNYFIKLGVAQLDYSLDHFKDYSTLDLYVALYNAVSGNAAPPASEEAQRLGKAYFFASLRSIRDLVCGQPSIIALRNQAHPELQVATAVLDLLAPKFELLPAFSLSWLVARYSLDRICSGNDLE